MEWFLSAARGHWIYPILVLAAASGCRRGELLALTWRDLDRTAGALAVSKSLEQTKAGGLRIKVPKNGKPRPVLLPEVALEALEAHRQEQEENRRLFGPDYRTDLDLVFCTPDGDYFKPDSVTATAYLLARKSGLKGIGLHSFRHSHGSQLLHDDVPLPTVSKRLGHSSVQITAAIYAHSFTADELTAAKSWDSSMRHVIEGPRVKQ
jgi:integrase